MSQENLVKKSIAKKIFTLNKYFNLELSNSIKKKFNAFVRKTKKTVLSRRCNVDFLWVFFALTIFHNTWIYPFLYKSYWHLLLCSKINNQKKIKKIQKNYLSINVDSGGRIGHQLGNYNAALWYAKKFNLIHPFTWFWQN